MELVWLDMRSHCSARGQIGTGTIRAALGGPAEALHSIVGWVTNLFIACKKLSNLFKKAHYFRTLRFIIIVLNVV